MSLARNQNGNVTLFTAMGGAVFIGLAGLTLLYLQGVQRKTALQAALDAGVLAGTAMQAPVSDSARVQSAKAAFYANIGGPASFDSDGGTVKVVASSGPVPQFTVSNTRVSGMAEAPVNNALGAPLGITEMHVKIKAIAAKRESSPICVLTLNPMGDSSLYVYGDGKFDADCAAQIDSTNPAAGAITGSKSSATASAFGVTGNVKGEAWSPAPVHGTDPVTDPYASLPIPTPGPCLMTNAVIKASTTLDPGTYCGGLTIKTGATATLNPGIYIMLNGQLRTDSGGQIQGQDLMVALEGADAYLYFAADSAVKLTSPRDGVYKNMQVMSDRDLSQSKFQEEWSQVFSGATFEYDGVLYLPEQQLWISGTGHQAIVQGYSPSMALVVGTLWVQGNAVMQMRQIDRRNIGPVQQAQGFQYGARLIN
jgi:hypothetical protein